MMRCTGHLVCRNCTAALVGRSDLARVRWRASGFYMRATCRASNQLRSWPDDSFVRPWSATVDPHLPSDGLNCR